LTTLGCIFGRTHWNVIQN